MRDSSTLSQRLVGDFVANDRVHELVEHLAILDRALPHSPSVPSSSTISGSHRYYRLRVSRTRHASICSLGTSVATVEGLRILGPVLLGRQQVFDAFGQRVEVVGFCEERLIVTKVLCLLGLTLVTRAQHDGKLRAMRSQPLRQPEPVLFSWHVYIGKNEINRPCVRFN